MTIGNNKYVDLWDNDDDMPHVALESDYSETEAECTCDSDCDPEPPEEPRPRCAREKWFEEELVIPIKMGNDAVEALPKQRPDDWQGDWQGDDEKSIVMNLYLDCDAKSAGEIIKAANRETRAVCTLDNEVPCKKSLVIMKGPQHEVKKANEIMESQLKKLHTELSGYKPMHVLLEGVGSVEVCIIHVKTNPHSKTG